MSKKITGEESRLVLLRTSADVASHALTQIDVLASEWPSYAKDAKVYREFVERLVANAKEVGYIEKRGKA